MKKTVLLLAACSMVGAANAQSYRQILSTPLKEKRSKQVAAMLHAQQQNTANKTTVTKQRVIAEAIYNTNSTNTALERTDSANCKYSGIRGSKFDFEYLMYNYDEYTTEVNYDTATLWDNSSTGTTLAYTNRYINKYNTAGKRDTLIRQAPGTNPNTLVNDTRYRYTYNSSGNVSVMYEDSWSGSAWTTDYKTVYVYNSSNKVLADTTYSVNGTVLSPEYRDVNTFDASGNMATNTYQYFSGSTWYSLTRYTYSYYTNNKLKLTIEEMANGAHVLKNSTKDSLGYTTNIDFHTYEKYDSWDSASNSWVNYIIEKKHINSSNLPDSMNTTTNLFGLPLTIKLAVTYNSYGNPTVATGYNDLLGLPGSGIVGKTYYYYDTYNDPTGIAQAPKYQSLVLYPNPATDEVSIKREEYTAKDIATVWNAAGQKMIQQSAGSSNTTISISLLAPGMYWLSVENERGVVARQSFIKK